MAMQTSPGASLAVLGLSLGVSRSAIVSRLHKLARRRTVAKGHDGHWRIATWEPEPSSHLTRNTTIKTDTIKITNLIVRRRGSGFATFIDTNSNRNEFMYPTKATYVIYVII